MDTIRVLFVGETYTGVHTYVRGSDYVTLPDYSDVKGAGFCDALNRGGDIRAELMPSQEVLERFPLSMEALSAYDVVVISDVGSNTFLKNPKADGRRFPNRLELLRRFVEEGGRPDDVRRLFWLLRRSQHRALRHDAAGGRLTRGNFQL